MRTVDSNEEHKDATSNGHQTTGPSGISLMLHLATQAVLYQDAQRKRKWGDYCVKCDLNKFDITPDHFHDFCPFFFLLACKLLRITSE